MISFVIPVFNEEESLRSFYTELTKAVRKLKQDCEIVFVDDGSTDKSLKIIKDLAIKDKTIRVFSFRKKSG